MRKLTLLTIVVLFLACVLNAQPVNSSNDDDIIKVNYQKKSVSTALLLSCAVPGLGQFYGNHHALTTYIFPIIEVGLWVGYINYTNKGNDIESDYKDYADAHYNRQYQKETAEKLCDVSEDDIYEGIAGDGSYDVGGSNFFRLDDSNSQHYYEDIGKYPKYIFGWTDWHDTYVDPDDGYIAWGFDTEGLWIGNRPYDAPSSDPYDAPHSDMQTKYDVMRNDAETNYDKADLFTIGLVANHILSGLDAIRVTRAYNQNYLSSRPIDINLRTVCKNDRLTPMLVIGHQF
jgi:hypothetical protein